MPNYQSNSNNDTGRLPRRTLDYLERGAPQGSRNAELFDAACQFRDAGLPAGEAEGQLIARALTDGLSESEALHTIRSAYRREPREAAGEGSSPSPPSRPAANNANAARSANDANSSKVIPLPRPLPEPAEDGFLKLLDTAFLPGEFVAIAPAAENEDGEIAPRSGVTLTAAQWRERVLAKGGIDRCFTTRLGLFVRINPMRQHGSRNEDVTAFRHVLVEFDTGPDGSPLPKEVQHAAIIASGLPVTALIDSGNKSLHAWVRVEARDEAEYRRRVGKVWDWFEGHPLDRQNRNPSRLSRCPDGWRTVNGEVRRQQLLALGLGAENWEAWEGESGADGLPRIVPGDEFMDSPKPEPPQLVEGILHQGAKMVLGGASKSRKSWSLIDLMLAVSTGGSWWGFPTKQCRVLYLNFELPDFAFQHRLQAIASAKGIADFSGFDIWNLRGYATDFSQLIPKILTRIKNTRYGLVILDPIYKGLGNRDENKAGDVASLCNEIEQLAVKSEAAVVFGAHYSKGNQAGKDAIDRIGGSGVFARDPDVILTMTPHEEQDAYVIDLTLRALPQLPPLVVRWRGVSFERDADADASRIRLPGKEGKIPSTATYRRGSVAERYGSIFEKMPPKAHHKEKDQSEVLAHIAGTVSLIGEPADLGHAAKIFDVLRNKRYAILRFVDGSWIGRNHPSITGEGGAS
jgi:RecA-family ATPase